jgi:hypothetical protein
MVASAARRSVMSLTMPTKPVTRRSSSCTTESVIHTGNVSPERERQVPSPLQRAAPSSSVHRPARVVSAADSMLGSRPRSVDSG